MAGEREWVETVKADIKAELAKENLRVETGYRLPYAFHIESYQGSEDEFSVDNPESIKHLYQTDLLIAERTKDTKRWVPRVVVEFKLGKVTTHDALTYSTKAATHKNVHPYLRYGIVMGALTRPFQSASFDMVSTLISWPRLLL